MFCIKAFLFFFVALAALQTVTCAPTVHLLQENVQLAKIDNNNINDHDPAQSHLHAKREPYIPQAMISAAEIYVRKTIKKMKEEARKQGIPNKNPWRLPELEKPRSPIGGEHRNPGSAAASYPNFYDRIRGGA